MTKIADDFDILIKAGNVGFYQRCEVTEFFIYNKADQSILNLYTIGVFEEKPYKLKAEQYITPKLLPIDKINSLGIKRYWLSLKQARLMYQQAALGQLKQLPRQFIPAIESARLNRVLKNNFHNGSHIVEFFDESKNKLEMLLNLNKIKVFNKLSDEVKAVLPIDLSLVRDRAGNIVFQFPLTVLKFGSSPVHNYRGVSLNFKWHHLAKTKSRCQIMVESKFDGNYLAAIVQTYNLQTQQTITPVNLDQPITVKIWRKTPALLIGYFHGTYFRSIGSNISIGSHEPRLFEANGIPHRLTVSSKGMRGGDPDTIDYTAFINSTLYDAQKNALEKTLAFKQYFKGDEEQALSDIRRLIQSNDRNGVYLWDPYLRAMDILNTLYFSPTAGTSLKTIGALPEYAKEVLDEQNSTAKEIITAQQLLFESPANNNYGLNLEFRLQHGMHGYKFHDRFLIFPGGKQDKPKVYTLGVSVNSLGKSHHILSDVSHPQRVIDAFDELWEQLKHPDCLVWKSKN
jgi:hypothetical protein